jgi:hypothetical protein
MEIIKSKLVKVSHIEMQQNLWIGLQDIRKIAFMDLCEPCGSKLELLDDF